MSFVGLRLVQQVATFESCERFFFYPDLSEPYHVPFHVGFFSSSSSSCTCLYFSNVLKLYVAIFSRYPLAWWFFLTQIFLAPPVCSLGGPESPPTSQTAMLLETGGLGLLCVLCMLVFMAYPSLGSCVSALNVLSCYLTQSKGCGVWSTKPR